MFKYGGAKEFGRTTLQVFQVNLLRLGKRKPVRQLKKAGGINKNIQQSLYTHPKNKNIKIRSPYNVKISETFI